MPKSGWLQWNKDRFEILGSIGIFVTIIMW